MPEFHRTTSVSQLSTPYQVIVDIGNEEIATHLPGGLPEGDATIELPVGVYHQILVQEFEKEYKRSVCLMSVLQTGRTDHGVRVIGNCWVEPNMAWPGDSFNNMLKVMIEGEALTDDLIDKAIGRKRVLLRFSKERVKFVKTTDPIVKGDYVSAYGYCRIPGQISRNEKFTIGMTPECHAYIRKALMGLYLGDQVSFTSDDPNNPREWSIQLNHKMLAPEVTDEELCTHEGVPHMEALKENIKRSQQKKLEERGLENLFRVTKQLSVMEHIPSEFIYDWANGHYTALLLKQKERDLLRKMQVESKEEAIQVLAASITDEYVVSIVAKQICKHYDMLPTEEELEEHVKKMSTGKLNSQNRYLAMMDFCRTRVKKFIETGGKEKDIHKPLIHLV